MAKLYAELTSDKGGRVASKGGDEYIKIMIIHKKIKQEIVISLDDMIKYKQLTQQSL